MITSYIYSRLSELGSLLRERVSSGKEQSFVFMLPSMSSEDMLLDMLAPPGGYFGETPEVWSWSALYSRLVPRSILRRQIDPPDHMLVLLYLRDKMLAELDGLNVQVPSGVRRRGFLDMLSQAVKELLLEDVPPDRLLGINRSPSEGSISSEELLYRLYNDYLIYLEENGLADNSQLPSLMRSSLRGSSFLPEAICKKTICWVGFLSLTGSQLKLVRALDGLGAEMEFFIPDTGLASFYDIAEQLDITPDRGGFGGRIISVRAADIGEQFECIAREISLACAGSGELHEVLAAEGIDAEAALSDIGIMVTPERLPLMASALERYGVASQARTERSVYDSALIFIVRKAWEAASRGWPLKSTRYLLSHPIFGDLGLDEGRMMSEMPEGLSNWLCFLPEGSEAKRVLCRLNDFCLYLGDKEGHTAEELLRALLELSEDEWESRAARAVGGYCEMDFAVREVAACRAEIQRKLELLSELTPALGEAGLVRYSGADAAAFLADWSREADITMEAPLAGVVTLYNSNPPVLASHRLWVMTDVDSSRYPGSPAMRSLLGSELRDEVNRLVRTDLESGADVPLYEWEEPAVLGPQFDEAAVHLPTLREKREQKEALFRRMLAVGEDLTLLAYSVKDSNGRPQSISPFVQSLEQTKTSISDKKEKINGVWGLSPQQGLGQSPKVFPSESSWIFCSEIDAHKALFEELDFIKPIFRGPFPRSAVSVRQKVRVSLSSLDSWLRCPFAWWCEKIAGISSPKDASLLEDTAFRGTLTHALWESVWGEYLKGGESLHSVLVAKWDDMLKSLALEFPAAADPRFAAVLSGIKSEMSPVARLQDIVEERARSCGFVREETLFEYRLPPYESEHVIFSGKVDRIDIWRGPGGFADSWAVLVDYKSGEAMNHMKNDLQLAAYVALYRQSSSISPAGFCYIGHKSPDLRGAWLPEAEKCYKTPSHKAAWNLEERLGAAEEAMQKLDEAIASGEYRAEYDSEGCRYCQYSLICRRAENRGAYYKEDDDEDDYESAE